MKIGIRGKKIALAFRAGFGRLLLLTIFTALLLPFEKTSAQVDNSFLSGAKKGERDTLAMESTLETLKESESLLEREVDPEKYIVGPQDEFTIAILASESRMRRVEISPEGIIIIPEVGGVDVKDLTLAEAKKKIKEKIAKVFSAGEIYVSLSDLREFKVYVSGKVMRSMVVAATAADRVSEVIDRAGGLEHDASLRNITVIRKGGDEILGADLLKFYFIGDKDANPYLLGGDHIVVPPSSEMQIIGIYGDVHSPNEYEFMPGDSLSTLVKFAQGFLNSAQLDSVEFVRFRETGNSIDKQIIDLSLWRGRVFDEGVLPGDFPLKSGDRIFVRKMPERMKPYYVVIEGEVRFPGKYAISRNKTTVRDLLYLAGGITENGSAEASIMIRQEESDRRDPEMERLSKIPYSEMSKNEIRYYQSKISEKRGVMAIDFERILEDMNSDDNIILQNKDSIIVPEARYFVNVQGRVNNPGLVVYKAEYNYLDYIEMAGGFGYRSDPNKTFIHKSKGEQFLAKKMNYTIEPGDYILVPPVQEADFVETLTTVVTITAQFMSVIGVVIALMRTL